MSAQRAIVPTEQSQPLLHSNPAIRTENRTTSTTTISLNYTAIMPTLTHTVNQQDEASVDHQSTFMIDGAYERVQYFRIPEWGDGLGSNIQEGRSVEIKKNRNVSGQRNSPNPTILNQSGSETRNRTTSRSPPNSSRSLN